MDGSWRLYWRGGASADSAGGGVRPAGGVGGRVRGRYVAGEAVGGETGANRLTGNAITGARVCGRKAGKSAAEGASRQGPQRAGTSAFDAARARLSDGIDARTANPAAMIEALQTLMQTDVCPFQTASGRARAIERTRPLPRHLAGPQPPAGPPADT